jgi:hypothetical protein
VAGECHVVNQAPGGGFLGQVESASSELVAIVQYRVPCLGGRSSCIDFGELTHPESKDGVSEQFDSYLLDKRLLYTLDILCTGVPREFNGVLSPRKGLAL